MNDIENLIDVLTDISEHLEQIKDQMKEQNRLLSCCVFEGDSHNPGRLIVDLYSEVIVV